MGTSCNMGNTNKMFRKTKNPAWEQTKCGAGAVGSPSLESSDSARASLRPALPYFYVSMILRLTGGKKRGEHPIFKTTFWYKLAFSIQTSQIKTKREYKKINILNISKALGFFYQMEEAHCNTVNLQSERFYVQAAKAQRNICTSFHDL